jgi:hypothetical protein
MIATPAMIHFYGGTLVFNCAVNTYVAPLVSVLYAGHWYTPFSSLPSAGKSTALQITTGTTENYFFG